ncbi:MAG: hypothetical protein J1F18_14575, partial [Lachnospiraceae bacterium]|nr:hypothetical protein [Lachnospiraceae bacterium]
MKTVAIRGYRNEIEENLYTDQKDSRGRGYKTGIQNETNLFYPDKKNELYRVGILYSPSRQREYALRFDPFFAMLGKEGCGMSEQAFS